MTHSRQVAWLILRQVQLGKKSSAALNLFFKKNQKLSEADRGFITELVYGTLRWRGWLDCVLRKFSSKPISKLSFPILETLRLGIYQLLFLQKVPSHAAIFETVELVKKSQLRRAVPFINAILREVDRNKNQLKVERMEEKQKPTDLADQLSHPLWLFQEWVKEFGLKTAIEICHVNNTKAPLCVRVNQIKATREQWIQMVRSKFSTCEVQVSMHSPMGVYILNGGSVTELPGFKEGWFQVQDEASQLVASVLDPKPYEMILDACAAPGGKATHIAELTHDQAHILAMDHDLKKIDLIQENMTRLGLCSIKGIHGDFLVYPFSNEFDRILVDAPCSAMGTFRRRPEAKWNRSLTHMNELAKFQLSLLDRASTLIKSRGVLVYSVCTFMKEETDDVVDQFLKKHSEFELKPIVIPEKVGMKSGSETVKILPQLNGMDGYYIAKFQKKIPKNIH